MNKRLDGDWVWANLFDLKEEFDSLAKERNSRRFASIAREINKLQEQISPQYGEIQLDVLQLKLQKLAGENRTANRHIDETLENIRNFKI